MNKFEKILLIIFCIIGLVFGAIACTNTTYDNYIYVVTHNIPTYYNGVPVGVDQFTMNYFDILLSDDGSKAILVDKK